LIPGTHDLALFIVSGLLLNIAPGPDSLLIVTRSASHGWRAGSAAALGIGAGTFVHVFAAALGLSAVLATSATAFTVVKYVGAAYLLYVGLSLLWSRKPAADTSAPATPAAAMSWRKIFAQGFLTNALNPKVAIFFLAFVPQFISADAASKPLAFIALGCIFNFNSMIWAHFLAVSAAMAGQRIRLGGSLARWLNRAIGVMFISFGIKLALAKP
jgi:threonine/homoserine/homoserine lactone efflux protein